MLNELTTGLGNNVRHREWRNWNSAPIDNTVQEQYLESYRQRFVPGSIHGVPPQAIHQNSHHVVNLHHEPPNSMTQPRTSSNDMSRHTKQALAITKWHQDNKKPRRTDANWLYSIYRELGGGLAIL